MEPLCLWRACTCSKSGKGGGSIAGGRRWALTPEQLLRAQFTALGRLALLGGVHCGRGRGMELWLARLVVAWLALTNNAGGGGAGAA
jgi:hypothetical protein